jgi:hypothetical protein
MVQCKDHLFLTIIWLEVHPLTLKEVIRTIMSQILTTEVVSLRLNSHTKKDIATDAEARINGATSSGDTGKVSSY